MRDFLKRCRSIFVYAGVFSFFMNLLTLTSPIYLMQIYDRVISSRSNETLFLLTLIAIGAFGVMSVLEMLRSRLVNAGGRSLDQMISGAVFTEAVNSARQPGENQHAFAVRDLTTLREFLAGRGILAFFDAPWAPVFVVVIFLFHWLFGLIALVGIGILLALTLLEERASRPALQAARADAQRAGAFADHALREAETVFALGMTPAVTARWQEMNAGALAAQASVSALSGRLVAISKFTRATLSVVMLAAGAYLVIDLHVTPGVMIAATLIFSRALAPIEQALGGWKGMVEAREAYRRLDSLLGNAVAVAPPMPLPAPRGRLGVEKLSYARTLTSPILKNVSLELEPGESLAVIGPNAAGKSTLARIIVGVWSPLAGAVRLDGADIREWERERLANYVGYLPQEAGLFAGTVADNIARLGRAEDAHGAVVAAAQRAHVHDMILRLPQGYDTLVGRGGTVLSGGQIQRIALARALFGEPRLVVLDEPNSNLDTEGEQALLDTLRGLKAAGVTVIMVTHRPSLIRDVDKMLLLRGGSVEAFGARADLLPKLLGAPAPVAVARPQAVG